MTIGGANNPNVGTVGKWYTTSVWSNGGNGPDTWTVTGGTMPPGVSLEPFGMIGGRPTQAGTYTFSIQVTDSSNPPQVATASMTIVIRDAPCSFTPACPPVRPLTIGGANNPNVGTVGQWYTTSVWTNGGKSPDTWTVTGGTMPPGVSLAPFGMIAGRPTQAGSYTFSIQVTDSSNPPQVATASMTIVIRGVLSSLKVNAPAGSVGTPYSGSVSVGGGTAPYIWSVYPLPGDSLPPGLSLGADGTIGGTPTTAGRYHFVAQVKDSSNPALSTTALVRIQISNAFSISGANSAPAGTVGKWYSTTVWTNGGTPPDTWSVTAGSLPPGVGLGSYSGMIAGRPTQAGTYTFTLQATDSSSPAKTATSQMTIIINGVISTLLGAPAVGFVGQPYSGSLGAQGGTAPYTWSVYPLPGDSLPPGLTLGADGTISGTPTRAGKYHFVAQVADSSNPALSATALVNIRIGNHLTIGGASDAPAGTVGKWYSATVWTNGGTPPPTWSVTAGSLPPGISLGTFTGMIAGRPTQVGTYRFTIQVTDSSNPTQSATATMTITIGAAAAASKTAATFSDVAPGSQASSAITAVVDAGVINGLPGGTFAPNAAVSRAQFVTMLDRTLNLSMADASPVPAFADVKGDSWYAPYVAIAAANGVVNGTGGNFDPNGSLTREQMAVLLARSLHLNASATGTSFGDESSMAAWAVPSIDAVVAAGYMQGTPGGRFDPLAPVSRVQAAVLLGQILNFEAAVGAGS